MLAKKRESVRADPFRRVEVLRRGRQTGSTPSRHLRFPFLQNFE